MAADIRIQLASEHPLTQLRTLDMESSPCPVSLSIHPSDGRDPREWILKLKEQKPIYPPGIASIWLCVCLSGKWFWLPSCHSACWRACLPAWLGGWHSVLLRLLCWHMPGPLSFSLSPHHSETFLIAFLTWEAKVSINKMRNNQWTGCSQTLPWSASATEEGEPEEREALGESS